jgi:hypothetical protein
MGTTQAHISGQGSSTVEEVARQKTFSLKRRTNKHGEVVTRGDGKTHQATLASAVVGVQNWPTVCASEVRQGFQDRSRGMKGSQESLTTAVVKDAANWPTPNANEIQNPNKEYRSPCNAYRGDKKVQPMPCDAVHHYGQAAPASSSSHGSRQGLSWATPQAHDAQGPKTPEQIAAMRAKGHGVKNLNEQACWGTPTARDHKSGRGNEDRQYKELTPMVERQQAGKLNPAWVTCLMGLDLGFVDPMCPASVTKNWPRFVIGWLRPQTAQIPCDSSAMESCQPPQSELSEFSLAS